MKGNISLQRQVWSFGGMEEQDQDPPFWKLAKSILPEDASEEGLLEAAANLHEFMRVAYRMRLRREFSGQQEDLGKERRDRDR